MKVAGVVLCGGLSSRMGTAKASLLLDNKSFLLRAVQTVAEACDSVAIVAARDQEMPADIPAGTTVLRDIADSQGPMVGLLTGLWHFGTTKDAVYLSSCDTPLLKASVVRKICDSLGDFDAVIPKIDGRLQPLTGAYSTRIFRVVQDRFELGRRRMTDVLDRLRVREMTEVDFESIDPRGESFQNVNTPEEYERLLADFQTRLPGGSTGRP